MIFHFPPANANGDPTFLSADATAFAKLKIESKAKKRTVFLTEHTVLFVLEGVKLLHFGEKTIRVEPGNIVLLKKGIYVMAEYIEEGLRFEALLVFLHHKTLKEAIIEYNLTPQDWELPTSFLLFPTNTHINQYKNQLRLYFESVLLADIHLLQLKQKEIILLLVKTVGSPQLSRFLVSLARNAPEDIEYIVEKHLLQALSIADYASLSNRSIASFKRDFRKIFDASPRQWINRKRLEYACLLIYNTTDSIAEIADACGFENASYFIQLFKKQYGYTPMSLRSKVVMN